MKRRVLIHADIPNVWDALINRRITEKYVFGLHVSSDWKVGSPVIWKGSYEGNELVHKGHVLRIEPERLLQITDFDDHGKLEHIPSNYTKVTSAVTGKQSDKTQYN